MGVLAAEATRVACTGEFELAMVVLALSADVVVRLVVVVLAPPLVDVLVVFGVVG